MARTSVAQAIWWIRRDLRLSDNPALLAAAAAGAVVPVYIHAPDEEAPWAPGAASRAWLRQSLQALDEQLRKRGATLVLRHGPSLDALRALLRETGASEVHWTCGCEPSVRKRDRDVASALRDDGIEVRAHVSGLWLHPSQLLNGNGEPYRVFTPFWRQLRLRLESAAAPAPAPARLQSPQGLVSTSLDELLPLPQPRWDRRFWQHWQPGEQGALELFDAFIDGALAGYEDQRDLPDRIGTSQLSPHLHFGEVSPRSLLHRLRGLPAGAALSRQVEAFLRQLGWREFAQHVLFHFPHSSDADFNPRFEHFRWAANEPALLEAWQTGRTGVPIIDAGMRQLWQSGWMHNRVRMLAASFVCKNLRIHWREGARWFWETLLDADLGNNSMGWQWCAGTGVDAAPYFRVFNPVTQARRFDPQARYLRQWLPEVAALPDEALFEPWTHPRLLARLAPEYPREPIVDLAASRAQALAAWQAIRG